jgi:hypothetical protein
MRAPRALLRARPALLLLSTTLRTALGGPLLWPDAERKILSLY